MGFKKLIQPESVCVIGASTQSNKVGYALLKNIINGGFKGDVYPVNLNAGEILGKKCYPSVSAIPGAVDMAVIVVKRDQVPSVLRECVKKSNKSRNYYYGRI